MPDQAPSPITRTEQLTKGGFIRAGVWHHDEASGSIRFVGENPPREAGVYAYAIGGIVHYVGSAQYGLRSRLRHYEIAKTLRTTSRIRQEVLAVLTTGREVEVFTIVPPPETINGLPVDMMLDLKEGL